VPDTIPDEWIDAVERAIIEAATDFGQDSIVAGPSRDLARAALESAVPILTAEPAAKAAKWDRISAAWDKYCTEGAGAFDRDFDSRDLMRELQEDEGP